MKGGLGEKLRELRTGRGLSQREAARVAGISSTRYADFEKGFVHHDPERPALPSRELIIKLAEFYGYPKDVLLTLARYPVEPPEVPPIPSQLETEAAEVAETFRNLPDRERELLLAVVRTFRAKAGGFRGGGGDHVKGEDPAPPEASD